MSQIDVILPVLDEAEALPRVLGSMPDGYRPIVVDNGSSDGSGEIAAELGAMVVAESVPGFGSACFAGLEAARSDVVCFMDCDGSLDPAELPRVAAPVTGRSADLVLGLRLAERGAWPLHSRLANRFLARNLSRRAGVDLKDLGPMRAMRREALLHLGIRDRRFGWPLEMVLRADVAGWRITEVPVGYAPRIGRSKVTGTIRGTARAIADMSRVMREGGGEAFDATVMVIAKEPVAGRVKTRLTPPLSPAEAADVARASLRDTLDAVAATPVARRVVALAGNPAGLIPPGFEVIPQVEGSLDKRLAAAAEAVKGPVLVIGMDTPQVTERTLSSALSRLLESDADAVIGPAPDGGYWAIGLKRPDGAAIAGVRMSEPTTCADQRARLDELGLRSLELEELRDFDHFADALAIAPLCAGSRFADCVERLEGAERERCAAAR